MAKKRVTKKSNTIRSKSTGLADMTGEKLDDMKEKASEMVKEYPIASLAAAALIGAVIALSISRSKSPTILDQLKSMF